VKSPTDRGFGYGEDSVAFVITYDRILLRCMIDEVAVSHPLRLHELELLPQVRADQKENTAALHAVILQDAVIREDLSKAFGGLPGGGNITWGAIKALAREGDKNALAVLRLCGERLRLFESPGSSFQKYERLAEDAVRRGPCLVMSRYVDVAQALESVLSDRLPTRQIDGQQPREQIRSGMEWFRERPKGEEAALVMTRDLGGRGLDFPAAESVLFVSPRSNYQTVAQEIARIRSRAGAVKESTIYFYAESEEQAKAQRLAAHMQAQTFRDANLFELADPPEAVELRYFESRNMAYEESL